MNIIFYRNKYFFISLLLHFAMILGCYKTLSALTLSTSNQINSISATLAKQKPLSPTGIFSYHPTKRNSDTKDSIRSAYTSKITSDKYNTLLMLLHDAIAKQQIYPESALALQQTGTVTIQLTLYPNGQIENIKLDKSSGTPALDEAALAATKQLTFIALDGNLLTTPTDFHVSVEFDAS